MPGLLRAPSHDSAQQRPHRIAPPPHAHRIAPLRTISALPCPRGAPLPIGGVSPDLRRYVVHALKSRGVDTPKQPPVAAVLHSLAYPDEDGSWAARREDMPWLSAYFVAGPWGALCMYLRIAAAEL